MFVFLERKINNHGGFKWLPNIKMWNIISDVNDISQNKLDLGRKTLKIITKNWFEF